MSIQKSYFDILKSFLSNQYVLLHEMDFANKVCEICIIIYTMNLGINFLLYRSLTSSVKYF